MAVVTAASPNPTTLHTLAHGHSDIAEQSRGDANPTSQARKIQACTAQYNAAATKATPKSKPNQPTKNQPTNKAATSRAAPVAHGDLPAPLLLFLARGGGGSGEVVKDEREEMRCKLHPYANAVGVCAPCLRDRLLALAAERDAAASGASSDGGASSSCGSSPPHALPARRAAGGPRGFPRSVSPYAAHRRSDACAYYAASSGSAHQPNLLFFRTPQVGPAAAASAVRADDPPAEDQSHRKAARRRSFLAAIFGGGGGRHGREEAAKKDPPRRSTSWLSAIVRRKRRPDLPAAAASLPSAPAPDEEPESPGGSSNSGWWLPSPSPARQHRRRHGGGAGASGGDGISGFAVWLSPLVRPSSAGGRRRCQAPDPSSLGDSHRRHASAGGAASFGRNTSRKLADIGRFR
ncbi:hypothetical protein ACP70R_020840 [Stipagrostis hirtigluma subsp. patula]